METRQLSTSQCFVIENSLAYETPDIFLIDTYELKEQYTQI